MCLIVLVPLIASMHSVEVSGLAWSVLIFPVITCRIDNVLLKIEKLLLFIKFFLCLCPVQSFRGKVSPARRFLIFNF